MTAAVPAGPTPAPAADESHAQWTACANCAGTIHRSAGRCPHCGTHNRRFWWPADPKARLLLATTVVFAGMVLYRWLTNRRR
ncbi:hypothetical protein GS429_07080 [Natronorubrum sp. JWXQ-INN-674]|uniref:Uncharacterized protein n=1 Tax=Natronorubrum halalkaliphilum TaxID=2691917 RepID=A0A6B0VM36_9EURY|nr:hypothetical protein [Natronorubrum halalkaliphilum]MXV61832.1 hypothetical protein [Natronorubrum halalkaliphilum]